MIGSLLIANRGEIALRIMRTCRRLGIRTVAVFSDADRDAPHVRFADAAARIGPAAARESYLRPDAILEAARRLGAEAIHPGYGFLSERVDLPVACAANGIVFVGPSAECIRVMGAKIGSKRLAEAAGVPSVPGYVGDDQSDERLEAEAHRIGFPVMIKASAGGGGKGMRRVHEAGELRAAIDIARQEAAAAFGDPALLIEKLVQRPRHLEVQVAGDTHGNVVHLFERDCSVQRNNQKVLEEAPAPNLRPEIRHKLLDRGVSLARHIGYDNLGTVEFILEEGHDEPWFLEMNTRLQVEHPVTEAITGLDLVEWQIRIASGERLPATQAEIAEHGHAIEARVTAERADLDFRPDIGRVTGYREPGGIRIDSGITRGSEIGLHYDSLLAKAVAFGPTRDEARIRLAGGLRDFTILGPATTLPFLVDALEHPIFAAGRATTRFIADAFPTGWSPRRAHAGTAPAIAALLWLRHRSSAQSTPSAWTTLGGFRLLDAAGGAAVIRLRATGEDGPAPLAVQPRAGGRARVEADGTAIDLTLSSTQTGFEAEADNVLVRGSFSVDGHSVRLSVDGEVYAIEIQPEVGAPRGGSDRGGGSGRVLSPMPGVVAEIRVAVGDAVEAGRVVVVLESMKLFSSLKSEVGGTVTDIACAPGATVSAGQLLVTITPAEAA